MIQNNVVEINSRFLSCHAGGNQPQTLGHSIIHTFSNAIKILFYDSSNREWIEVMRNETVIFIKDIVTNKQ